MKHCCVTTLAMCLMMAAAPVHAQDQAASESDNTSAGSDIVVTAQKRAERLEDVPISIAVVGGEQLSAQGITNTFQLREATPGVNMSEVGIYLMPSIRGITTTVTNPGADANVAIYVDGFYQPSMGANVFDLADIDRMEVLKGPQGTLFGRNATGGAIQIFTKKPSFKLSGKIGASLGVYAVGGWDKRVSAFVTGPLSGDSLAASLAVTYGHNDGYMKNLFTNNRLEAENLTVRGKLLFERPGVSILLTGLYAHREDLSALALTALNGSILARSIDPSIRLPDNGYHVIQNLQPNLKSNYYAASLTGEFDVGIGTLTLLSSYQHSDIYRNDADGDASPLAMLEFNNPSYSKSFSQEINFASSWDGPLSLIGGLYYFRDNAGYDPLTIVGAFSFRAINKTEAYAGFAELTYEITPRLTAVLGGRYSRERRKAFTAIVPSPLTPLGNQAFGSFTPRASLRYEVADNTNLYFTFSRGFKSGLFDVISFNPNALSPERVDSYEAGFKTRQGSFSMEAALFHYNYSNLQAGAYRGGLNISENAGNARISGGEINVRADISDSIRLNAGMSYIPHAKYLNYTSASASVPLTGCTACGNSDVPFDASGSRLIRTPKLTATVGAEYTQPLGSGELGVSTNLYYSGASNLEVTGRTRQQSYATLSAEVSYAVSDWRFAVWGRNLTDNRRLIQVSQIGAPGDIVNYLPPLQVGVSINYKF